MKKGEIYEGVVLRTDFPNKGIIKLLNEDGTENTVTVKNTIPGQKISFRLSKKHGDHGEGTLIKVLEKAPSEIEPPCPHFGICGGCTYLNLPYEKELELKNEQIKKLLEEGLKKQEEPWTYEGIVGSPRPYEYRNKMEFSFGDEYKDGPLALGMHKRGSFYDVVSVNECRIVDSDYRKVLTKTLSYFDGISYYHKQSHRGTLRHLLVRKAKKSSEMLIAIVTSYEYASELLEKEKSMEEWKDMLLSLDYSGGKIAGILHIVNDSIADVVKADETHVLYGKESISEELLGLKFDISTFSFFQTNSLGAEVLYEKAREYVGDLSQGGERSATVFDLYSGTGTIAQLMAPVAKKVIGVEIVPEAVMKARENAVMNGLHNCEFIAGDVLAVLDDIKEKPDFIILDPPRDGVHPKALKKIIDYGVERLIYISCKPTSLVRDLESFLLAGYRVTKACAVDQFPWTANCETCVALVRTDR